MHAVTTVSATRTAPSLGLGRFGGIAVVKATTTILAASLQLIVARALGPEQYGVYAGVLALLTPFAVLSTLGYQQTVLRFGARLAASGNRPALVQIAKRAVTATILAGGTAFIILSTLSFWWEPRSRAFLFLAGGLIVPLGGLALVLGSLLRALERPLAAMLSEPLLRAAATSVVLAAGMAGWFTLDASHLLIATTFGLVLSVLYSTKAARSAVAAIPTGPGEQVPRSEITRATAYAFLLLAANGAAMRGIAAVLASMLPADEFGPYALATRVAEFLALPTWAVVFLVAPRFASLGVPGTTETSSLLLARARLIATALSAIPAVVTLSFPETLLGLVDPGYVIASDVLRVFSVKVLVLAAIGPSLAALTMLGGERTAALVMALSGALGVGATGLVAARWGALGGALVQSAVEIVVALACLRAVAHRLGGPDLRASGHG